MSEEFAEGGKQSDAVHGGMRQWLGLVLPFCFILYTWILPAPDGMTAEAWSLTAIALSMAVLWMTEVIPIPITALLPLALFPALNICSFTQSAAPYADPIIYLFMGGFFISLSMQKWGLHRRVALFLLGHLGSSPRRIILGFLFVSALISMWVSNAATTLMMLPIALSVIGMMQRLGLKDTASFAIPLLLSLAYGASLGGLGTPIGTPPNALLMGHMKAAYNVDLQFVDFMKMGVPTFLIALPLTYWLLTRVLFRVENQAITGASDQIHKDFSSLGSMNRGEWVTAVVFCLAALLWVGRGLIETRLPVFRLLGDSGIAMACGLALFIIPINWRQKTFVMDWPSAKNLPWDVLILFGGGLSLAKQIETTGLATSIGQHATALQQTPPWLVILILCLGMLFLTEMTSNTAMAATFLPLVTSLATASGHPPMLYAAPVCFAASCAFMLPVATPPNAIVFGSGLLPLGKMAGSGLWLNLIMVIILTLLGAWFYPLFSGSVP